MSEREAVKIPPLKMDNTSARLYTERKGAVEGEDTEFRAGEMGRSRMGLELE